MWWRVTSRPRPPRVTPSEPPLDCWWAGDSATAASYQHLCRNSRKEEVGVDISWRSLSVHDPRHPVWRRRAKRRANRHMASRPICQRLRTFHLTVGAERLDLGLRESVCSYSRRGCRTLVWFNKKWPSKTGKSLADWRISLWIKPAWVLQRRYIPWATVVHVADKETHKISYWNETKYRGVLSRWRSSAVVGLAQPPHNPPPLSW